MTEPDVRYLTRRTRQISEIEDVELSRTWLVTASDIGSDVTLQTRLGTTLKNASARPDLAALKFFAFPFAHTPSRRIRDNRAPGNISSGFDRDL